MDLDTILDDVQERRESDVGINAMDTLLSLKDGVKDVLNKIADVENKQTTLQNEIDVTKNHISGEVAGEAQSKKTLNEHSDVTDELSNASASDKKTGVNADVNGVDEQTFASTDNSDKAVKNFRRASVDATMLNLDTVNVDVTNNHTDLSFSNYQLKCSDEDVHYVTNPKRLEFELVVASVFSIFTLVSKIEAFVSSAPEAALCTGALFSDGVKRQMEAYSCLHKPAINAKSWSAMPLDEATLRARLIAAPINKGAIILELQGFKSPFGKNADASLSPDKLVGVLSKLMTWLKEHERLYYLCTFYDYHKSVYGLDSSRQPPNVGAHGLIATMFSS